MTLDEIAQHHQTDKASVFTRTYAKPKDYCRHYEKLFAPLRDLPIKLLEVGVGGGESIRMWLQYFPNARVFGVDNMHNTNQWDTPCADPKGVSGAHDRYTFVPGDQARPEFWEAFIAQHGGGFDICVDDGSHINTDIIMTFIALWPTVKPGGFYAIEDLGTAYGGSDFFVKPNLPNHMDWLKGKLDMLNTGGDIDSMTWSRELVVIRKAL